MKRFLSLLLITTLCLSLCACGNNDKPDTNNPKEDISLETNKNIELVLDKNRHHQKMAACF